MKEHVSIQIMQKSITEEPMNVPRVKLKFLETVITKILLFWMEKSKDLMWL